MKSSRDDGKKLRLTVFLIKEGYKNVSDFLQVEQLQELTVDSGSVSGTLYFKSGFPSQPPWASIFRDVRGFNPASIVNRSSRALYVIRARDRWFCFTFGYTRHLIDEAAIERNFGLIVALNLGDPDAIKAIDKTNISHVGLQSREQAGRDVGFDGFEFDTEIDLLKAITAKAPVVEGEEQETYSGRDSFAVYMRVNLATFSDIAERLHKAYQSTAYKKRYPWVDKITQERDSTTLTELDAALVAAINSGDVGKVWLAVPDIVSWEDIEGFAYKHVTADPKKAGPALAPDIDLENWLADTKLKGHVTSNHLGSRRIYQHYKDGREPGGWMVYRCLNAEIDLDGQKYILNDGDWYNVDRDYVDEIDKFYQSVPASPLKLPSFGTRTEPVYLKAVPKTHPQFAVMDRKNVMIGGGRSRVEFCDLYSKGGDIVHVKQYGGSSVLSHLFSQAVVSGECFLHETAFRHVLNSLLPAGFKLANPDRAPDPAAHDVCVAIMSKVKGALEIPFFSKVSFKQAVTSLRRMNYKVTKLKIER